MNSKKYLKFMILALIVVAVGVVIMSNRGSGTNADGEDSVVSAGQHVVIYKSASCGCCTNHAAYLRRNGFDVEVIETEDMNSIKEKYKIPAGEESCHTAVIGDYVVEGHMPVEAINDLLTQKPDVAGIGMAGMPAGSPGMPGSQKGPFEIYSFTLEGQVNEFIKL